MVMVLIRLWLLFSHWVVSNSLCPHGLQHARLPCPSLSPGVCANSCLLNQWCHPTISSCCTLLLQPPIFPSIGVFFNKLALCIRWPKYCSFSSSISPSNEDSGLISFRIDWFELLAVQGTLNSLLQSISSLVLTIESLNSAKKLSFHGQKQLRLVMIWCCQCLFRVLMVIVK